MFPLAEFDALGSSLPFIIVSLILGVVFLGMALGPFNEKSRQASGAGQHQDEQQDAPFEPQGETPAGDTPEHSDVSSDAEASTGPAQRRG